MLTLVLTDAELELIPEKIQNHPSVLKHARRRGKKPSEILLDSTYHHSAIRVLDEWERRGRPDIVHISLLTALESILNREGLLRVYIHTRNDLVISVNPKTRLPRNYNRFVGLMEKLLLEGRVPPERPLLKVEKFGFQGLLKRLNGGTYFVAHEKGEAITPPKLGKLLVSSSKPVVFVGAFPHGDYIHEPPGRRISIYSSPLMAWTVVGELVYSYELWLLWGVME